MPFQEDLTPPCDSCGKPIGGGYKLYGKSEFYFCLCCLVKLMYKTMTFPQKCPICNREFINFDEYRKQMEEEIYRNYVKKAIESKKTK